MPDKFDRTILRLSGPDTRNFLQGLVTNDVAGIDTGLIYTALLTPQGKYMADFFLLADGEDVLLDVSADLAPTVQQRLTMYKLRANVVIEEAPLFAHRGLGERPQDGFADPRHSELGWRAYRETPQTGEETDWRKIRVTHLIPETGIELSPDVYILEAGFERLNGVDFKKGCYVGQEVTARMKHKTELRKGLVQVSIEGHAPVGTEIMNAEKPAGTLFSQSGDKAIAFLRFDRAKGDLSAGPANVKWEAT